MPSIKPKLAQLTTPVTATFPSELSALSACSPLSAVVPSFAIKQEELPSLAAIKTPISPPTAYTDFLKAMSLPFPPTPGGFIAPPSAGIKDEGSSTTSSGAEDPSSSPESGPGSASSQETDYSCKCGGKHASLHQQPPVSAGGNAHKMSTASASAIPPSPFSRFPTSAPPTGAAGSAGFPGLHIPPSPAISMCSPLGGGIDSPLSASAARSPFSARSVRSPFDWDAALKARYAAMESGGGTSAPGTGSGCPNGICKSNTSKTGRTSVRHIREVVTRTVTYTPKMAPAPKGKRRKVE